MQPQFALVNGAACRYLLTAGGPTALVLVHELGGSLNSYDGLVGQLPSGLSVLRYDVRGAGMSEKVAGTLDLDLLADDLAALIDHVGIEGSVSLLGTAVGATIAVRFATRHPQRLEKLILVAPAFGVPPERHEAAREMTDRLDREGMRSIADTALPRVFPDHLWADPRDKATATARWLGADPQGYAAAYRMLVKSPVRSELAKITCPVLVLAGLHDPFNPPEAVATDAGAIPDMRMASVEGGHFMSVQSPDRLVAALGDFLDA
jgi:3-oxoadipate enol-lactonase